MSWMEITATIFGLACVWLTVKANIWNWPVGLVQVFLYIFVFWQAKLYSDAGLQVVYIIVGIYGWWYWLHGSKNKTEVQITSIYNPKRWSVQNLYRNELLRWTLIAVLGTGLWGWIMATHTDAACPYADGFVVVTSLVAQWLMAKKKLESWWFWIAVDVMAVDVYLYKDLYFTSALYAVFLGLAITGYFAWKKTFQEKCNLLSKVISSPEGRQKLAQAMIET